MSQIKRRIEALYDRKHEIEDLLTDPDLDDEQQDKLRLERAHIIDEITNLYL